MTVTFSPAALLETVPESATASPKMLSVRDADSETRVRRHGDRPGEACRGRSVYANVPAVGKAHTRSARVRGSACKSPGDLHTVSDRVGVRPTDGIAALHRRVGG